MARWWPGLGVEVAGQAVLALVPARLQLGQASRRYAVRPGGRRLALAGPVALLGGLLGGRRRRCLCAPLCLARSLARFCPLLGPLLLALLPLQRLALLLARLPLL